MAETDTHCDLTIYVREALKIRYALRPDVYVSGNNFLFWQERAPKKRVSPDCYVVFGVANRPRDSYKAWEEGGKLPHVIFEFTSRKTRREDTDTKRPLYESVLKVPEYFLFDPTGDYLKPRLQGYRLQGNEYVRLELVENRLFSEQLGLELIQDGESLILYDPQRRERLPTPLEQAQRALAAEAEAARLRTELEALRRRIER